MGTNTDMALSDQGLMLLPGGLGVFQATIQLGLSQGHIQVVGGAIFVKWSIEFNVLD